MVVLAQVLFAASLAGAALFDLATRRIPDAFALAIVAGFALAAVSGAIGTSALAGHLGAGAMVFAGAAALFFAGWMGGGDVKLMSAAALWIGAGGTPRFLVLVALAGGVVALAVIAVRLLVRDPRAVLRRAFDSEEGLPYGVAIAASALIAGLPLEVVAG